MDGQSPGLDFALIGHQDTWEKASAFLACVRSPDLPPLSLGNIREIFPWIPPRKVFHIYARSTFDGRQVKGAYIETFMPPDKLTGRYAKDLFKRVCQAGEGAVRERAKIVTLGGFTSIVLEGNLDLLPNQKGTVFTTGNTLTAALIVKGVERASEWHGIDLEASNLLVIGSTGDIGSACVSYFHGKVKRTLLCARRRAPLVEQWQWLKQQGADVEYSLDLDMLLPRADIIISVASTPEPLFSILQCREAALICDAGYPKNIIPGDTRRAERLWHGGIGQVLGGYYVEPDYSDAFYDYPVDHVAHGCLLESFLLAMEGRYEPYSTGRGNINTGKIEEIWGMAMKHGFTVAPFFNQLKLWDKENISIS